MAPLGILTAIVGAIRVSGADWLKRLVGRARETTAGAEIELMSSVSQEVCEVWNGSSIVRSMGSPQVKQIIHLPAREGDFSPESFITTDQKTWSRGYELKARYWNAKDTGSGKLSTNEDNNGDIEIGHDKDTVHPLGDKELIKNKEIPPNISLNIHGGGNSVELVVYALIATILQVAVLGWSSYAYKRKLTGSHPSVGFPLQAAGTVLLTLSLVLCAGIIDNGSRERHWLIEGERQVGTMSQLLSFAKFKFQTLANKLRSAKDKTLREKKHFRRRHMQLYWVQKQHIAGDNSFSPYILFAKELTDKVHESHRAKESGQDDRDDEAHETHRPKQNGQSDRDDKVHEPRRAKENGQNDRDDKFLGRLLRLFGRHLTTYAAVIGVLGFVAQFQGLRFSNWTCSIAQLIALGFATILRAWVRRAMTKTPVAIPVDNDYILDHLTLAIVGRGRSDSKFPHPEAFGPPEVSLRFGVTTYPKFRAITESKSKGQVQPRSGHSHQANSGPTNSESRPTTNVQDSKEAEKNPNPAQEALNLRVRLGRITKWTGVKSQQAIVLSNSIETALKRLSPKLPEHFGEKWPVILRVDTYRSMQHMPPISTLEEVELYITKDCGKWKVDDSQLEALLSLVSYSGWTAEQNKRNQEGTDRETYLERVKDSRSIGWLRAKAPGSQIYDTIVGKSSPRLISDLHWWVSDTEQVLKEAKSVHTCRANRVLADFTGPLSDADANCDKVERPALGFYMNDETLGENGMFAIQRRLWRALTCPDIFCSWECKERQVSILFLFSAFIWATAPHLSASQFHPTTVITPTSGSEPMITSSLEKAQLKSDKIETLVRELQSTGLATSKEIYKMFIPPLSHFGKLPNEAVADWCNEMLIEREVRLDWFPTFRGYICLLDKVRHREAQDRFANRVAAMFVEFLLRVNEEPSPFVQGPSKGELKDFHNCLRGQFENRNLLKAILSVNDILARRWYLPEDDCGRVILRKLGLEKFLVPNQSQHLPLEDLCPSDGSPKHEDFSFPGNTDVFGWTTEYWEIFKGGLTDGYIEYNTYKTLDLAGRSVLHHLIDSISESERSAGSDERELWFHHALNAFYGVVDQIKGDKLFTTKCNKQTLLHRAARVGRLNVIEELLALGAEPNAEDYFGRTALCLAAQYGNSVLFKKLCDRMDPDGRNRADCKGRNALHYAILNHKEQAALDLIDSGIDINAEDYRGGSPLWYAGLNDMNRLVASLLWKDEINLTPLDRENWVSSGLALTKEEGQICQERLRKAARKMIRARKRARVEREELEREGG